MRRHYLDNVRWITVVLVVIYHVFYMFNGEVTDGVMGPFYKVQQWDAVQYIIYPWCMVLLFVVSGMSSRYYLEAHPDVDFLRSRTRKLLVPSTLGLLVFQWTTGYFNMYISGAFGKIPVMPAPVLWLIMSLSGIGVLWYIQVLWLLSMSLLLIRKLERDRLYHRCERIPGIAALLLVFPLWGAAQILNTPVITVYRFGIYGLSFLAGYFVFSHDTVVRSLTKLWLYICIAAIVLAVTYVAVYFGENYAAPPVRDSFLSILFAWTGALAMLTVMKRFYDEKTAFTEFMSRKSWGLYVFHYLGIASAAYLMFQSGNVPAAMQYLICTLAAFAGSFVLCGLISRIPVLRYCVLGVKGNFYFHGDKT